MGLEAWDFFFFLHLLLKTNSFCGWEEKYPDSAELMPYSISLFLTSVPLELGEKGMEFPLSLRQCLHIYPKLGLLRGMVALYHVTKHACRCFLSFPFPPVYLNITGLFFTMLLQLVLATALNLALSVNFI